MEQEKEIKEFIEIGLEKEPRPETKEKEPEKQEEKKEEEISYPPVSKKDDKEEKEISEIKELKLPAKVTRLFELAENKGLVYAIGVAKKTGDGFLIDVFRDRLAQDNYYKRYLK